MTRSHLPYSITQIDTFESDETTVSNDALYLMAVTGARWMESRVATGSFDPDLMS